MLCSKPSFPLTSVSLVAGLSVFLHASFGAHPLVSLWHECFNELEYPSSKGGFDFNLRKLMKNLIKYLLQKDIYASGAEGVKDIHRRPRAVVYGMTQCWSKFKIRLCRECITKAFQELRRSRCPNKLGAIIWYEHCLVKCSDTNFLRSSDTNNGFYVTNGTLVGDPTSFDQAIFNLLVNLCFEAYTDSTLYVHGSVRFGASLNETLYGAAQCTGKKCLDVALRELDSFQMVEGAVDVLIMEVEKFIHLF